MFRSLMFKSNPLTEEFQRYRKKVTQTLETKPFSIKSHLKKNQKSIFQKSNVHYKVKEISPKTLRYQQLRTINQTTSIIPEKSPDNQKQKFKFKIHNTVTLKNDNFLQKDEIMPGKSQKQVNPLKGLKTKNSILNPESQKQEKINHSRLNSRYHQRQTKEAFDLNSTKLTGSINLEDSVKNKLKHIDPQLQKKLKSTLYQSIDLGNLFEKIESNIDQSQKKNSSNLFANDELIFPESGDKVTKRTKIRRIELNKQEIKGSSLQNKNGSNRLNLKNLIEKNETSKTGSLTTNTFEKSLTSRQKHTKKQTQTEHLRPEMNQKTMQHSWMPTRRKKSIAIVMDQNGLIKQESSGALENEADSLRMSMKISNIKQLMRGEQLEFD